MLRSADLLTYHTSTRHESNETPVASSCKSTRQPGSAAEDNSKQRNWNKNDTQLKRIILCMSDGFTDREKLPTEPAGHSTARVSVLVLTACSHAPVAAVDVTWAGHVSRGRKITLGNYNYKSVWTENIINPITRISTAQQVSTSRDNGICP